jgi:molybdate/tungstate transport system substrate-binding protein
MRALRSLAVAGGLAAAPLASGPLGAQEPAGPLVVFHAGSLTAPLRDLLAAFRARHPRVDPRPEASGSVEAARKLIDLGKPADVLATADAAVMEQLVVPGHAAWYATFASNAMVLAYTDRSAGAAGITAANWHVVLRRPGVRIGRSDPAQDPAGYRALMLFQLAERHYGIPGLAGALLANSGPRYTRPKSVELTALLQTGHLDYAVEYRTVALGTGMRFVALPPEIDLSDPARAAAYAHARVDIPRSRRPEDGMLTFTGEPIAYAVAVPRRAPNPVAAAAFVRFLTQAEGRAILARHGFVLPAAPAVRGDTAAARAVLGPATRQGGAAPGPMLR